MYLILISIGLRKFMCVFRLKCLLRLGWQTDMFAPFKSATQKFEKNGTDIFEGAGLKSWSAPQKSEGMAERIREHWTC